MRVELIEGAVLVSRPKGAPRIAKESTFWHALQRSLNTMETQPARRWYRWRPEKVALTSMPFALRQGPPRKANQCVLDDYYALRNPAKQYNDGLTVRLRRAEVRDE